VVEKPGYTLKESREIYSGRIFSVRMDRLHFNDGKEVTMEVVRHGGAAAVVPVRGDGRLVLIRQFRYTVDRYIWEVPAGKLDAGEESDACAARELEEETGYRAGRIEKIGSILTTPGFSDEKINLFIASDLQKTKRNLEPDEFIDVVDVTIDEALDKIEHGEIEDSKTVIALYLAAMRMKPGWIGD